MHETDPARGEHHPDVVKKRRRGIAGKSKKLLSTSSSRRSDTFNEALRKSSEERFQHQASTGSNGTGLLAASGTEGGAP